MENFENNLNEDIDEILQEDDINIKDEKRQERRKIIKIGVIVCLTSILATKTAYDVYKSSISIQKDLENIYYKLCNMDYIIDRMNQNYTKTLR